MMRATMMRKALAVVVAVAIAAALVLVRWEYPGRVLGKAEVDAYLRVIDTGLALPAEEKADILAHLRAWAEADDGKPVFMLNLMRYYDTVRDLPGLGDRARTPREANAYYETVAIPLLVRRGAYPLFAGTPQGVRSGGAPSTNVLGFDGPVDNWSRVLVVRYPDRRTFLEYLSDPAFLAVMPYKIAALNVSLVPLQDDITVPDVPWLVGALVVVAFGLACMLVATRPQIVGGGKEVSRGH